MKRTYRFQKFDTVEKPKQESKPLVKENKKRSRISPPRRKIYSFSDLRISEDCGSIDLTKKNIETFAGLPDLKYLVKLNLDSNPLKSFEGSPKLPKLRWLSARNSPISRNPYFKLMAVIVFGNNITTINNEKVMPQIHKQATDFRDSLYDELLKGRIIANLRPLRFIDTKNEVVVNAEPEILSKTRKIGYKAPSVQEFERTIVERSREQFRIPSIASICDEIVERDDDEGYNYFPESFMSNFISQLHGLRGKYNATYENTSSDFDDSEEESNNDMTQSRESINDASPIRPPRADNIAQRLIQSEAESNSEIRMSQSGLEEEANNEMKDNSLFEEEEEIIKDQIGAENLLIEEEEEEKNENKNIEGDNITNADQENKEEEEENQQKSHSIEDLENKEEEEEKNEKESKDDENDNANSSEHHKDSNNDGNEEENQNENVDNEKGDNENAEVSKDDENEHSVEAEADSNKEEEEKSEIHIEDDNEEEEKTETEKSIDNPEESNQSKASDQNNQEDQNENLSEDSSTKSDGN